MSVLFALVTSLCAAVVAVLFVTMWLDGDGVTTTALAVALLPVLVLLRCWPGERRCEGPPIVQAPGKPLCSGPMPHGCLM